MSHVVGDSPFSNVLGQADSAMLPLANTAPSVFNVLSSFVRPIPETRNALDPVLHPDLEGRPLRRGGRLATSSWSAPGSSARPPPAPTPTCRWACAALRKVEQIVREEMDRAGAHGDRDAVAPAGGALAARRGRMETYGPDLVRIHRPPRPRLHLRAHARGDRHGPRAQPRSAPTSSCRSTSTRSRPSSATRCGRASASFARRSSS